MSEQQQQPAYSSNPPGQAVPSPDVQRDTQAARIAELEGQLADRDQADQDRADEQAVAEQPAPRVDYDVTQLVKVIDEESAAFGSYGFVVGHVDVDPDPATDDEQGSRQLTVAYLGGGTGELLDDQVAPVEG